MPRCWAYSIKSPCACKEPEVRNNATQHGVLAEAEDGALAAGQPCPAAEELHNRGVEARYLCELARTEVGADLAETDGALA